LYSLTIRTGCSASLVCLNEACAAISKGDCNAAIVGGTNLILAPGLTATASEQGILSPNASCKTFSADADGYARAEGIVAVYIKTLKAALRVCLSLRLSTFKWLEMSHKQWFHST
jgi:acyl transferase domain-containing protein